MLQDWIRPELLTDSWIERQAKAYAEASPFPHANVQGFLREERFAALKEAARGLSFTHKESDLFGLAQTADLSGTDTPVIAEFAALLDSAEFRGWMERWTGVPTRPGRLDLFGAVYQDTDYLLCHDDRLEDRKIAFILYLTTLDEGEGGGLSLYTDKDGHPHEKVRTYRPEENSLNCFTVSTESWHEVEEVVGEETFRVSLGGWLRG